MPSIPDIPGKGLLTETTKRARVAAGAAVAGGVATVGLVAKRVIGHLDGKGDEGVSEAAPPSIPTPVVETPAPKPRPAKPKAGKPKPAKPKAAKPKAGKPKAAKPKAKPGPKVKATKPTGTDAPQKPAVEPGDRSHDKEPHHALNNPVRDPDETEYPDPFEKRDDPRDPVDPDDAPFGEEPHPPVGSESTSEPRPTQDPEVGDLARPPKRENLDD